MNYEEGTEHCYGVGADVSEDGGIGAVRKETDPEERKTGDGCADDTADHGKGDAGDPAEEVTPGICVEGLNGRKNVPEAEQE